MVIFAESFYCRGLLKCTMSVIQPGKMIQKSHTSYLGSSTGSNERTVPNNRTVSSIWMNHRVPVLSLSAPDCGLLMVCPGCFLDEVSAAANWVGKEAGAMLEGRAVVDDDCLPTLLLLLADTGTKLFLSPPLSPDEAGPTELLPTPRLTAAKKPSN